MSSIIPDFKFSKQCSAGREERLEFILSEVKKHPDYNFEGTTIKERCSDNNAH